MENFNVFFEKLKKFDDLHVSHVDSSGALFSTTSIRKPQTSAISLNISARKPQREFEKSSILERIRRKDESFLQQYSLFLRNFSAIDSQYMRIYEKFLNSIFRNGSYQNCIKELIKMYNELTEEFNNFVSEYEVLIRIKTYQDLELMPDDYLSFYEEKLEAYLRNIKEIKLQRNSKYLKIVKKRNFEKKATIFEDNCEFEEKFLRKNKISLNEILREFDKIYAGDDNFDENMVESLISQKVAKESCELQHMFFRDISNNFAEDLEKEFEEFEVFLEKILGFREESKSFCRSQRKINRNLFDEFFRNERKSEKIKQKLDFPLQIQDDLTYSKSFCNKTQIKRNSFQNIENISFQNSLKDSKENINSNFFEKKQVLGPKPRRNRSERLKYNEKPNKY